MKAESFTRDASQPLPGWTREKPIERQRCGEKVRSETQISVDQLELDTELNNKQTLLYLFVLNMFLSLITIFRIDFSSFFSNVSITEYTPASLSMLTSL